VQAKNAHPIAAAMEAQVSVQRCVIGGPALDERATSGVMASDEARVLLKVPPSVASITWACTLSCTHQNPAPSLARITSASPLSRTHPPAPSLARLTSDSSFVGGFETLRFVCWARRMRPAGGRKLSPLQGCVLGNGTVGSPGAFADDAANVTLRGCNLTRFDFGLSVGHGGHVGAQRCRRTPRAARRARRDP